MTSCQLHMIKAPLLQQCDIHCLCIHLCIKITSTRHNIANIDTIKVYYHSFVIIL